jgi:predicted DNA-binding mobile mystery protein A
MSKKIQINQIELRMKRYAHARELPNPPTGWIRAIRLVLGMSLRQLATKLSITQQSVQEMEIREKDGSITLRSLKEAAAALDMELVYGFVPKDGSLDAYIDKKAQALAEKIVLRTSNTMKLEGQENKRERIIQAIEERKSVLKSELPKALWD